MSTSPETKIASENRPSQKGNVIFQPLIFMGYISFREGSRPHIRMIKILLESINEYLVVEGSWNKQA